MNQLSLFDNDPVETGFYGQTLARQSDPVTSHIAAQEATAKAGELHKVLASWLNRQKEPKTCREIAEGAKRELSLPQEVETLRKRAGELEDFGASEFGGIAVRVAGVRNCSVTGKLAETWETY